jgi:hypothetical protein
MAKSPPASRPASKSLSDAIRAAIPPPPRRTLPWHERLPADVLAELEEVKREHRAGKLQGTRVALAITISEQLRLRGLSDVGRQGIEAWLRKS